jgi:hypothetical protein
MGDGLPPRAVRFSSDGSNGALLAIEVLSAHKENEPHEADPLSLLGRVPSGGAINFSNTLFDALPFL